ncbi:MAG TPA: thioredoxin family protein [Acidimicrobiales bacterium]|nr:thioredoxin family protein [Acidimicrobiales bacterium]
MSTSPKVQLLYFKDCPNWRATADALASLMSETAFELELLEVKTDEEAEAVAFRGSPTVLIDGIDPFGSPDAPIGLSCRLYHGPRGLGGAPTTEQLRDALVIAAK